MKLNENKMGKCPICCEENLEYGVLEPDDIGIFYPWCCKNEKCSATGKELYTITFYSHEQVKKMQY